MLETVVSSKQSQTAQNGHYAAVSSITSTSHDTDTKMLSKTTDKQN